MKTLKKISVVAVIILLFTTCVKDLEKDLDTLELGIDYAPTISIPLIETSFLSGELFNTDSLEPLFGSIPDSIAHLHIGSKIYRTPDPNGRIGDTTFSIEFSIDELETQFSYFNRLTFQTNFSNGLPIKIKVKAYLIDSLPSIEAFESRFDYPKHLINTFSLDKAVIDEDGNTLKRGISLGNEITFDSVTINKLTEFDHLNIEIDTKIDTNVAKKIILNKENDIVVDIGLRLDLKRIN